MDDQTSTGQTSTQTTPNVGQKDAKSSILAGTIILFVIVVLAIIFVSFIIGIIIMIVGGTYVNRKRLGLKSGKDTALYVEKSLGVVLLVLLGAIAVVLVVLFVVVLPNIGTPSSNQASLQCQFPAGFICLSGTLAANGLFTINLEQATSSNINVTAIGCNTSGQTVNMRGYTPQNYLPIGNNITLTTFCYSNAAIYSATPGSIYIGYLILNYTDLQTGFPHTAIAQLTEHVS